MRLLGRTAGRAARVVALRPPRPRRATSPRQQPSMLRRPRSRGWPIPRHRTSARIQERGSERFSSRRTISSCSIRASPRPLAPAGSIGPASLQLRSGGWVHLVVRRASLPRPDPEPRSSVGQKGPRNLHVCGRSPLSAWALARRFFRAAVSKGRCLGSWRCSRRAGPEICGGWRSWLGRPDSGTGGFLLCGSPPRFETHSAAATELGGLNLTG